MKKITLISLLIVWASNGNADFPLKAYNELIGDPTVKEKLDDYMIGVGRGVFWSNTMLEVRGDNKLFCIPSKLQVGEGIILDLLRQEINSPSKGSLYKDDTPVELILTNAFIERFPC